jgi:hypothetical protein
MYGYGYKYASGLVLGAGGGAPFLNTYSLDFDGVDDYLDVGTDSSLDIFGSDFTISLWAKWGNQTTNSNGFINFGGSTNKALVGLGFGTEYGKISFGIGNSTSLSILYNMGSGYNDNQWHSIICKITSGVHAVYVDGVDITGVAFGGITVTNNNAIGGRSVGGQNRMFVGNIDEVSIYDKALTSEEITSVSTAPIDLTTLNPIAWYRNGDNGSYKSPQWLIPSNENKDKVSNYSFDFDGVDDFIDLNRPSELLSATNFSISCWFKPSLNALKGVFTWFSGGAGWIELSTNSNGSLNAIITDVGVTNLGVTPTGIISINTWVNAVMVFNGSGATNADRLKLYINGSLITFSSFSGTIPTSTGTMLSGSLNVGERYNGVNYFNGNIDEYSIFNYSLSAAEALTVGGSTPTDLSILATPPTHWYKMGEEATFSGGVWTVPDAVGSNDGTSNAMTIEDRIGEAPNSSNNALSFNMGEVDRTTDVPT